MAFCPSCGSSIDAGATACAKCGSPSSGNAASPQAPVYVTAPSPNSYQPGGFQPGYGAPLPDASPMALILAAVSWAVCGPILSVPALFMARSDIRKIREGQLNPNSLTMSQIAFWVAAANVALCLVSLVIVAIVFGGAIFFAAAAAPHMASTHSPTSISTPSASSPYEAVERNIETLMASRPESERKLWRQTRDDLRMMRRQKGTGVLPEAKGLADLLRASTSNEPLWTSLTLLEQKAAQESGRTAPARPRPAGFTPAEAPNTGPPPDEEDD